MSLNFIAKNSLFLKINLVFFFLFLNSFSALKKEPFFNKSKTECAQIFLVSFAIGVFAELFLNKNKMDRVAYPFLTSVFSYVHKGIEIAIDEAQQTATRIRSDLSFGIFRYPSSARFNLLGYVLFSFFGVSLGQYVVYYLKNKKLKNKDVSQEEDVDQLLQDFVDS